MAIHAPITGAPLGAPVIPLSPHLRALFGAAVASRRELEVFVDSALDALDEHDGDPDLEVDNEDCCAAYDDDLASSFGGFSLAPGDPEDAEEEEDHCLAGDDGCGPVLIHGHAHWGSEHDAVGVKRPTYGIDQSVGPISENGWAA